MTSSEDEGEHDLPVLRVVSKVLQVSIVLVYTPDQHLDCAYKEENEGARVATLDAEEEPGEELPPIVRTANPLEAPALGDATGCRPWLSQVSEREMSLQIQILQKHEEDDDGCHELLASCPTGRAVIRMQEEVHVNEPENDPVVEAVLE